MKIHLVDDDRNEVIEVDDNIRYYDIWDIIDKLIEKYNYSCISFPIPEINKDEQRIKVHWLELFGSLSTSYIEIIGVSESLFAIFEQEIERAKRRNERKNNKNNM